MWFHCLSNYPTVKISWTTSYRSVWTVIQVALKNFAPYPSGLDARSFLMSKRVFLISSEVIGAARFCCCRSMRVGPYRGLLFSGRKLLVVPNNRSKYATNSSATSLILVICSLEVLVMATSVFLLLFRLTRSWKNLLHQSLCLR